MFFRDSPGVLCYDIEEHEYLEFKSIFQFSEAVQREVEKGCFVEAQYQENKASRMSKKEQVLIIEPPIELTFTGRQFEPHNFPHLSNLVRSLHLCCIKLYEAEESFGQEGLLQD